MSSEGEKELLKVQYEILIRQELNKDFNTKVHYKFIKFFVSTILMGAFFAWCSAGDTSYFPKLLRENEMVSNIVTFIPQLVWVIYSICIIISTNNVSKKIEYKFGMSKLKWMEKFKKYIILKIGYEQSDDFQKNIENMKRIIKNHEDINFTEDDFADYLEKEYKTYKLDISVDFYNNLAKFILLDNEMKGTLVHNGYDRYVFIVKDNTEIMSIFSAFM